MFERGTERKVVQKKQAVLRETTLKKEWRSYYWRSTTCQLIGVCVCAHSTVQSTVGIDGAFPPERAAAISLYALANLTFFTGKRPMNTDL